MLDMAKLVQWTQRPAFLPSPDQWPDNRDVSNVDVDEESFELATAHTSTTIVRTCPSVGLPHLISSA